MKISYGIHNFLYKYLKTTKYIINIINRRRDMRYHCKQGIH